MRSVLPLPLPEPKELGQRGEYDALEHLVRHKRLRLLDRNFRTRWGELDLIMEERDGTVVFVEVKARLAPSRADPLEHIDETKIRHLTRAIEMYLHARKWDNRSCRLDAVGIEYAIDPEGGYRLKKLEHAEDLTGWV